MGAPVTPVDKDGNPFEAGNPLHVTGTGPGGTSDVVVTNFPASQVVTGPLTNAQFTAVQGTAAVAAWAGTGNGTTVAILKAIYAQNSQMITLLTAIRDNTTTG